MLRAVGGSPLTAQTSYQNLNLQKETLAYPQWATIHKDQNNAAAFNSIYGIKGIKNEGLFSLTSRVFDTNKRKEHVHEKPSPMGGGRVSPQD